MSNTWLQVVSVIVGKFSFKWCKSELSRYISERAVLRHRQYPSRSNTLSALTFVILVLPLAAAVAPVFVLKRLKRGQKLGITVLAIDGEFGPLIETLEELRARGVERCRGGYILVLSKHRHETLSTTYGRLLQCKVLWSDKRGRILQQVLLLQPKRVFTISRLIGGKMFPLAKAALSLSPAVEALGNKTLQKIGCEPDAFVALAVYTLRYDQERTPKTADKTTPLETNGSELIEGVRFLRSSGIEVVLLGSDDTGRSKIQLDFPRLSDFGCLGGAHEIALASQCKYFWTDDVGAWWLALPFKRPVLMTNKARLRFQVDLTEYPHLMTPIRYRRPNGSELTFREILSMKSAPFKAVSRGELIMIRNSPTEIVDAHEEMMGRLAGTWIDDEESLHLFNECQKVFQEFPDAFPLRISARFISKYQYLLS